MEKRMLIRGRADDNKETIKKRFESNENGVNPKNYWYPIKKIHSWLRSK